jgi:hypothetical protein
MPKYVKQRECITSRKRGELVFPRSGSGHGSDCGKGPKLDLLGRKQERGGWLKTFEAGEGNRSRPPGGVNLTLERRHSAPTCRFASNMRRWPQLLSAKLALPRAPTRILLSWPEPTSASQKRAAAIRATSSAPVARTQGLLLARSKIFIMSASQAGNLFQLDSEKKFGNQAVRRIE